ncbi:ThuA domain-containing protein, partial [candidate division KSB1 bacterium]|nr:ThuA domain-containing protein [candidate division KSB1 bacterium]
SACAKQEKYPKILILTGNDHPAHKWHETTDALHSVFKQNGGWLVDVSTDPEIFSDLCVNGYDVVVLNYCNWQSPGLSENAKSGLVRYLTDGGGLMIIHFSNGAFHFSLPGAEDSDWPEYRKICRRVWDHTTDPETGQMKSGHDEYGSFIVTIVDKKHPVSRNLKDFETVDELYFRQQGDEEIHVLATAHSKTTGNDEPIAFVYEYGKGRIFQTLLGHSRESLTGKGVEQLLRDACMWAAELN